MGNVTVTLTGDEARLLRALDRVVAKQREVGETAKRVNEDTAQSFSHVENALGRAFGAGAIGTLGPWALAIKGIEKALEGVSEMYKEIAKQQEEAAKNAVERGSAVGKLGRYAAGNRDVAQNLMRAQEHVAREGLSDEEAAKLVGEMAEGGYRGGNEAGLTRAVRLKRLGYEHAGRAAMAIQHLGGGGSLEEAEALAAATRPGEAEQLLESTDELRGLAGATGASQTELMATIAQAGKESGSTKTGAAQAKAFLTAMKARKYQGTINEAVKQFGNVQTTDENLEKIVGGKEGLAFLRSQQKQSGQSLLGHAQIRSEEDILGAMEGDEDVAAANMKAQAEAEVRDSQRSVGRQKARADAVRSRMHAEDLRDNGGEEGAISYAQDWNRRETPDFRLDPGHQKQQTSALREIARNTKPSPNTIKGPGDE